ncbi:MAG: phosphoenolpyruvate--protein phosphotransferase [Planctomycetota bacterium]|nr:phosphoenolpyruvate--protein phosphotransferase [Planctomycetota bacterium]
MRVLQGIPVSSGIVIGHVFVLDHDPHRVARWTVGADRVEAELERLDRAFADAIAAIDEVYAEASDEMGVEAAKIFLFHKGMLADPSLIGPIREMIRHERVNAEHAVVVAFDALAEAFRRAKDSAFRTKTDDIRDLTNRLLDHLMGSGPARLADLLHPTVIVATDLTPSQTAGFDRDKVVGFVTDLGGRTSHTAIVATALGYPAVVGCRGATAAAKPGQTVIVDGDRGLILLDPDEAEITKYRGYIEQQRTYKLSLAEVAGLPSVTRDGVPITLLGNVEFPEECDSILAQGGEGVGLYRSEFLYLSQDTIPTEEDHYLAYADCVRRLDGLPLTVRTVDLGSDKYASSDRRPRERNPALGLRSIRYSLADKPKFQKQLRAVLRASALGPVKIMFPMVTTVGELRHAKMVLRDVMEDLEEEGVAFDRGIRVGVMIEVPSAALIAGSLAAEVDFFSIGTNDLVQYTLAVDRTNEQVAGLYQPVHAGVLQLIRGVVRAAAKEGDIEVSCCGEAAGEIDYALLLIGLGLRRLSVPGSAISHLKRLVRSVTVQQCERVARKVRTFDSEIQAAAYLRDRTRKLVPEAFDGRAAELRD